MPEEIEVVEKDQARLVDEYGEYVMLCQCDTDTFKEAIIDCSDTQLGSIVEAFNKRLQQHNKDDNPEITEDTLAKLVITLGELSGMSDYEYAETLHGLF